MKRSAWWFRGSRRSWGSRRALLPTALFGAAVVAASIGAAAFNASAGASTTPIPNPPKDIPPCSATTWIKSFDCARADTGVPAVRDIDIAALEALPTAEEYFAMTDLERTARGLAPIVAMTAQLNDVAEQGAKLGRDPTGKPLVDEQSWSTEGEGFASGLEAVYDELYYDGYGGYNLDCTSPSSPGCWGHRESLLAVGRSCSGRPKHAPTLYMGAYDDASFDGQGANGPLRGSLAAIIAASCGTPPEDETVTWADLHAALAVHNTSPTAPTAPGGSSTPSRPSPAFVGMAATPRGTGYWEVAATGLVDAFGTAKLYGTVAGESLRGPIVGMAATSTGGGYWLVASDGGIFSFGKARFRGSLGGKRLARPIVGMAADPATGGYWLVASDGGIFSFAAPFFGSMGGRPLREPVVAMAATKTGRGYWEVTSDGGIFAFGKAKFHGSMGGKRLAKPVVTMAADPATGGYWLVASDGGIFSFAAPFFGSLGGKHLARPMVSVAPLSTGDGYWMSAADGDVFAFGKSKVYGSTS